MCHSRRAIEPSPLPHAKRGDAARPEIASVPSPLPLTGRGRGRGERLAPTPAIVNDLITRPAPSSATAHRSIPPPLTPPRQGEGNRISGGRKHHSDCAIAPSLRATNRRDVRRLASMLAPSPLPLTGRGRGWGECLAPTPAIVNDLITRPAPSPATTWIPFPPPLTPPRQGEGNPGRVDPPPRRETADGVT